MEYTIVKEKDYALIKFEGRIMGTGSDEFHANFKLLIEEGIKNVIGDLSKVSFINSTGLGMLISALISIRKVDGDFKLCSATDHVESLFKVSKLFTVFNYYKTLDKAVAASGD
jgi:anti-sigma B factor antagonist